MKKQFVTPELIETLKEMGYEARAKASAIDPKYCGEVTLGAKKATVFSLCGGFAIEIPYSNL